MPAVDIALFPTESLRIMSDHQQTMKATPTMIKKHLRKDGTTQQASSRTRQVRRSVIIIDRIADKTITIGGIMVIMAVLGILVFLVLQTLPLFMGGETTNRFSYAMAKPFNNIIYAGIDEYQTMTFVIQKKGTIRLFHSRTGRSLKELNLDLQGAEISTFSASIDKKDIALGLADGTIRLVRIDYQTDIITRENLPAGLEELDARDWTNGSEIYSKIPGDQYRKVSLLIVPGERIVVDTSDKPLIAVDYRISGEAERQKKAFITIDNGGHTVLNLVKTRMNLMTGKRRTIVAKSVLPALDTNVPIHAVVMTENADMVVIATTDGRAYRFDTSNFKSPRLVEISPLLPKNTRLTTFGFLNGGQSILVGGDDGSLSIFFVINDPLRGTKDKKALVKARSFEPESSPVVRTIPSSRGKSFVAVHENGNTSVFHGTSQKRLIDLRNNRSTPSLTAILSPRLDGLMTISEDGLVELVEFAVPHPETTFKTLFQKVWYEGYTKPGYTWQSSAGTDDYEQKFSLIPLIFGSIKAAFYSMLFAIPIAILGAIYTSEFVEPSIKRVVKPAMEMMASLPSVVLGFVAALVLAPIVEDWISAVLFSFLLIPLALIIGAFLWQILPVDVTIRWQGYPKMIAMFILIALSILVASQVGDGIEQLFFEGDFKAWLNLDTGTAFPFLFLILVPISMLLTSMVMSSYYNQTIHKRIRYFSRPAVLAVETGRWVLTVVITILLAYGAARFLTMLGIDARNGFVGTYVQRNTLVVGFAMGFAVIPIIYTIAEDALSSVPDHLRAASLGCGATVWQTTIYVVLPAAISGVFSAVMIGMGRAVGETMIVVMAAGNTPLLDWNIFNGLRALSATIAVELPEAVKDGTLYRVLFLSGLVLFAMTFIINTIAEIIRLRFRKRTMQL